VSRAVPHIKGRRIYIEDGVGVVEVTLQTVKAEDIEAHVSLMLSLTSRPRPWRCPSPRPGDPSIGRLGGAALRRRAHPSEWNKKLVFLYHNPCRR